MTDPNLMNPHEVHPAEAQMLDKLDLGTDEPVIFDVGANVGGFTAACVERFPNGRYALFEPNPGCIPILEDRFPDHHSFTIHEVALSDGEYRAPLYLDSEEDVLASLHKRDLSFQGQEHGSIQVRVQCRRLEGYLGTMPWEHVDLLKIDAEGHEISVLRGAGNMLGVVKAIFWEYNSCALASRTFFKDFWDLLYPEFDIYQLMGGGTLKRIERYTPELEDFAAHRDFFAGRV